MADGPFSLFKLPSAPPKDAPALPNTPISQTNPWISKIVEALGGATGMLDPVGADSTPARGFGAIAGMLGPAALGAVATRAPSALERLLKSLNGEQTITQVDRLLPRSALRTDPLQMTDPLLTLAQKDTAAAHRLAMARIENDAQGVVVGQPRGFDKAVHRGEFSLDDVAQSWNQTRQQIRQQYGDRVTLHRFDAPVETHHKDTLTLNMGDKKLADRFGPSKPYTVPTNDIVAVNAPPNGYYEFIVKKPQPKP